MDQTDEFAASLLILRQAARERAIMKYLLPFSILLISFALGGCGEDKSDKTPSYNKSDKDKIVSSNSSAQNHVIKKPAVSYGDVVVTIAPTNPIAADCLVASVKGLSAATFAWEVNGINVQQNKNSRYCLEEARRGDVVGVSVGDAGKGGNAWVTVGNSLPRVLDSRLEFVEEGGEYFIEITPQVEDADGDYVELAYQWLINGQVNETYIENRMPSNTYKTGDSIQVKITPEDGYGKGRSYMSRNLEMSSAAPVITSKPPKSFQAMEYTYQVEATDVDSCELTFSLEDAPDGINIDAATGLITWPLAEASAGEYQIKIIVTDPDGSTGRQEFTLNLEKRRPAKQNQE